VGTSSTEGRELGTDVGRDEGVGVGQGEGHLLGAGHVGVRQVHVHVQSGRSYAEAE
jgi:hypothetical protein